MDLFVDVDDFLRLNVVYFSLPKEVRDIKGPH